MPENFPTAHSRRSFIRFTGLTGLALTAAPTLAACGGSDSAEDFIVGTWEVRDVADPDDPPFTLVVNDDGTWEATSPQFEEESSERLGDQGGKQQGKWKITGSSLEATGWRDDSWDPENDPTPDVGLAQGLPAEVEDNTTASLTWDWNKGRDKDTIQATWNPDSNVLSLSGEEVKIEATKQES